MPWRELPSVRVAYLCDFPLWKKKKKKKKKKASLTHTHTYTHSLTHSLTHTAPEHLKHELFLKRLRERKTGSKSGRRAPTPPSVSAPGNQWGPRCSLLQLSAPRPLTRLTARYYSSISTFFSFFFFFLSFLVFFFFSFFLQRYTLKEGGSSDSIFFLLFFVLFFVFFFFYLSSQFNPLFFFFLFFVNKYERSACCHFSLGSNMCHFLRRFTRRIKETTKRCDKSLADNCGFLRVTPTVQRGWGGHRPDPPLDWLLISHPFG